MDARWAGTLAAEGIAGAGLVIALRPANRQARQEYLRALAGAHRDGQLAVLQERLIKVEEAGRVDELEFRGPADIRATREAIPPPPRLPGEQGPMFELGSYRFTLINRGGAAARYVDVRVGAVVDPSTTVAPIADPGWPLAELRPGHDYSFGIWQHAAPRFLVDVSRSDPSPGAERVTRRLQVGL